MYASYEAHWVTCYMKEKNHKSNVFKRTSPMCLSKWWRVSKVVHFRKLRDNIHAQHRFISSRNAKIGSYGWSWTPANCWWDISCNQFSTNCLFEFCYSWFEKVAVESTKYRLFAYCIFYTCLFRRKECSDLVVISKKPNFWIWLNMVTIENIHEWIKSCSCSFTGSICRHQLK